MSISIPLLDRPSAVGDEGRPRQTSLAVASFTVAALVGVAGYLFGQWNMLLTLGTFTGLTSAGAALLDRERFVHLFFGHALLSWFGWPLALFVVTAPSYSRTGLAIAGFAVALTALGATWGDTADRDGLRRTVYASGAVYIVMGIWLVVFLLVGLFGAVALGLLVLVTEVSGPTTAPIGFCLVVFCSATAALFGIRWLPVRQLAPASDRTRWVERVERARSVAIGAMVAAIVGAGLVGVVDGLTATSKAATGLGVLASWPFVGPVAAVGGATFLAGAVAWLARAAAGLTDPASARHLAVALAALPLSLVTIAGMVLAIAAAGPVFSIGLLLALLFLVSPFVLVVGVALLLVAAQLYVLPDRAGGPALSAAALLVAAVGAAATSDVLAFACVAVALLVWDTSTYGLGITAELGLRPDTRRLELVHGVVSLAVALGAVGFVSGLDALRTGAFSGIGGAFPVVVACLGLLFLVLPLRG